MNDDSSERQQAIFRELVDIKNSCDDPDDFICFLRAAADMLCTAERDPEAYLDFQSLILKK